MAIATNCARAGAQASPAPSCSCVALAMSTGEDGKRQHARHFDREPRTVADVGLEGDCASQEMGQAPHDGQTQAGPAGASRIHIVGLTERLEDTVGIRLSNSDSRVDHHYPDAVGRRVVLDIDRDVPGWGAL